MIVVVDYGCGNLNAFINSFKRLNKKAIVATRREDLKNAKNIILPGVGSFDHVMKSFNNSGLREEVEKKVLNDKVRVLGVCAGMQIMSNSSEEGVEKGLGWIPGEVKKIRQDQLIYPTKLPHMGWNEINQTNNNSFFKEIKNGSRFYFVHSYYFECHNESDIISKTEYGRSFASAINKNNIFGVQFHPEKSHQNGQKLLKNFTEI